ncbi:MAG: hypothetical protein ACSLE1_03020 [Sphingobium sp.]
MARKRRTKTAAAYVAHIDATPERLSKGDISEYVNPAEIDPVEQALGRVRRFKASTLDRLHSNGKLTYPQFYAGELYRNAYHRAAIQLSVVSSYGERTSAGEPSYGLPRTITQLKAREFVRDAKAQLPFEMRGFMDRLLIHDDLPRYGGRKAMRTIGQIRHALDQMALWMRLQV